MANTNRRRDGNRPGPPPAIDRVQQKASYRQTARGQRVDPPGARLGQGPTPDAKIRQRVLNRNQDARRNMRERRGASGPPEMGFSEGFTLGGEMPRRERPIGTPPGQAAPPPRGTIVDGPPGGGRIQDNPEFRNLPRATQVAIEKGRMSLEEALGRTPKPRRMEGRGEPEVEAGPVQEGDGDIPPGQQQAPVASAEVATSPTLPQGAEGADQVRTAAAQEIAAGGLPAPPGEVDAQGDFRPSPGISEQEAASSIQAQTEAVMQQQPEPPMPKSSLGADSPIEQADSKQKLRSGTRHHIREIGMQTAGMDPKSAKELERKAVRDFDLFGEYPGMDDPHSPPPPIRPGKNSFNPMTGQWVTPEGQVSVLDRMAPSKARGPDTVMTADAVRKGEVR